MRLGPINVTVTIHAVHVHVTQDGGFIDDIVARPTEKLLRRMEDGRAEGKTDDEIIDEIVTQCAAPPVALESEKPAVDVPAEPPKRGRKRKSSPENDADILAQAQQMATPAQDGAHVDHDITSPAVEQPHDASTGEVIPLIAPDAPELASLRDGLRAIGKEEADDAVEFLTEETGRRIERLGQLTVNEVQALLVKIESWKRTYGL